MTNGGEGSVQEYVLARSGDRPVKFRGVQLLEESTSADQAAPDYSGVRGISETARIYRTQGGSYVLAVWHHSQWDKDRDVTYVEVFGDAEELIEGLPWHLGGPVLDAVMVALGEHVDTAEVVA